MKYYHFLFVIVTINSLAQNTQEDSEIIRLIATFDDPIIYTKESLDLSKIKNLLNRNFLGDSDNHITLNKSEMTLLNNEVKKNRNFIWDKKIVDNSEIIPINEIQSFLQKKNIPYEREFDSVMKTNDSAEAVVQLKNRMYLGHTFSKPIFFRNNKFCIIGYNKGYYGRYDMVSVVLLRKRNGKWQYWAELYSNHDD